LSLVQVFYLHFLAPVRIGAGRPDASVALRDFPSDTLSAALVIAAAELGGERVPPGELAALASEPPWIVSSLLPWVGLAGRPVRFVPRPVDRRLGERGRDEAYRDVAYISLGLLKAPGAPRPVVSRCGALAATPEEAGDELAQVAWQRRAARASATIDRVTGAPQVHHVEELAMGMGANAGAWLAVRAEALADIDFVRVLLGHLADSGIGADRARGLGRFEIVRSAIELLDEAEDPDRLRVLLGYASPDAALEQALSDRRARYAVVRRDGIAHGLGGGLGVRRRSLRLLAPGSVIPDQGAAVGVTRDVTPEGFEAHRIWRDGRTLALPLTGRAP
jgi:CRISPR-associated protein Csm4